MPKNKVNLKRNEFWGGFNKKGVLITISKSRRTVQENMLTTKIRWTYQTFRKDWQYMIDDGFKIKKVKFIEIK